MLEPYDPQQLAANETYNAIFELLISHDISKAVAITALLNVIADIYTSDHISDDSARLFVEDAARWLDTYFHTSTVEEAKQGMARFVSGLQVEDEEEESYGHGV